MKFKQTIIISSLGALLVGATLPCVVSATGDSSNEVTVRIEGISNNLYYDTVDLSKATDLKTVADVLNYVDEQDDNLTITGIADNYITDVNGETAGKFGGYDGWLYRVNDTEPNVGVGDYTISNGDNIVLYYGDPFGVGMQYPNVELKDNVLTVTSSDAVYDENYNATYVTSPISDLTVYWDCNGSVTTYTTNEQGQVTIDAKLLTKGKHNVAVSKVSESGIPLVLRLPKDYTVEVTTTIGESTTVGDSEPTGVRGDINYDGKVTTVDLLLLKKYLLGIVKW